MSAQPKEVSVEKQFNKYLSENKYIDLCITIDGKKFYAHRAILCEKLRALAYLGGIIPPIFEIVENFSASQIENNDIQNMILYLYTEDFWVLDTLEASPLKVLSALIYYGAIPRLIYKFIDGYVEWLRLREDFLDTICKNVDSILQKLRKIYGDNDILDCAYRSWTLKSLLMQKRAKFSQSQLCDRFGDTLSTFKDIQTSTCIHPLIKNNYRVTKFYQGVCPNNPKLYVANITDQNTDICGFLTQISDSKEVIVSSFTPLDQDKSLDFPQDTLESNLYIIKL